jgi:K+-sensing histidine kinase KdpD
MGIGLSLSKQLVKAYGGELDFISDCEEPNRGSTFVFTFDLLIDQINNINESQANNDNIDDAFGIPRFPADSR